VKVRKNQLILIHQIGGIPRIFWYGQENNQNILVMELLDQSVDSIFVHREKRVFSMMTILLLID
jgi:hypothetical protein